MLFSPTNIEDKLRRHQSRDLSEQAIINQVHAIFESDSNTEARIQTELITPNNTINNSFNIDLLETNNIYHIDSIKAICIDYRLRFLDTKYFKGEFPQEAINKIKAIEKVHNTTLKGFKIMAPSKLFKLDNPDDPLLFAPIGNGYYYLIHKWGNDLNPFRKWLMLPFKNFENLMVFGLLSSFLLTYIFNLNTVRDEQFVSHFLILFLFMFKSVIGIVIFYAISQGKNVNTAIWDSKYSK